MTLRSSTEMPRSETSGATTCCAVQRQSCAAAAGGAVKVHSRPIATGIDIHGLRNIFMKVQVPDAVRKNLPRQVTYDFGLSPDSPPYAMPEAAPFINAPAPRLAAVRPRRLESRRPSNPKRRHA